MNIAVDVMGGDYAPSSIIKGAIEALDEVEGSITLVGNRTVIEEELKNNGLSSHPFTIVNASQSVEMNEAPASAVRKKKDSSITNGLNLLKKGEACAFVSAGNTGAVMASATLLLRPLDGIDRPAIAIPVPTITGPVVLLDAGANVDCKPKHLVQFAIMGHVYAKYIFGKNPPRVGLLSNGEEEEKGTETIKKTAGILKESSLNFIGSVEGKQLYNGIADVVVTDGFTGNIVLKVSESLAGMVSLSLKNIFSKSIVTKMGYLLLKKHLDSFKKRLDYSEYGGAPLLGVNGVCIIAHGSSSPKAFKNAIIQAEKFSRNKILDHIREEVVLNSGTDGIPAESVTPAGIWDRFKNSFSVSEKEEKS
ncbi:MAG: phosphate acyltransferase PlsX [Nitrospinota bacterium]